MQLQTVNNQQPTRPFFPEKNLLRQYKGEILFIQNIDQTIGFNLNSTTEIDLVEETLRFIDAMKSPQTFMVGNVDINGGSFRFITRCEAYSIFWRWIDEMREVRKA